MDKQYTSAFAGQSMVAQQFLDAKPANAFDSLEAAVSNLRDMQKMAQALAERLTGSGPVSGTANAKLQEIGGGGLIDGIDRQASAIREIHADIYASLSRIENRL